MDELTELGKARAIEIMRIIEQVREEHQACTAREVARLLRLANTVCFQRMLRLQERGFINWTSMSGSVHITEEGSAWLARQDDDELPPPPRKKPAKKAARPALAA